MPKKNSRVNVPKDRFFLLGFGLFFLGVISTFLWLNYDRGRQVDRILSDETLALVQLKLNTQNLNFLQAHLRLSSNQALPIPGLSRELTPAALEPWIGSTAHLAWLPQQQFMHAFSYRKTSAAKAFMRTFLLPEETLSSQNTDFGTIYTPAYSSTNAFLFYKGWLWWADSPNTLLAQLQARNKLAKARGYQQLNQDLPNLKLLKVYVNFSSDTSALTQMASNPSLGPLLQGLGQTTPHWGLSLQIKNKQLQGDMKVLTHQDVYDPSQVIAKAQNRTVPDLAYFAPKNALFFQNGHNLYAKYQHTKRYLNQLDPQLGLVFEGLIRAQAETWFGPAFDFENEFLALIRDQYAFILDFNESLEIGFISALSPEQDSDAINQLIQKAQSRFTPVTQTVELPDGTVREELVAQDPQEVPISKKDINGQTYYTSKAEDGQVNFSYTQIGNYLVMTNRASLVQKIIGAQQDQRKSLAANDDFRQSVLFSFSPAEVYGFLNAPKLQQLNFYWAQSTGRPAPFGLNFIGSLRNLTFSKQVFEEAIFLKLRWFFNS